MGNILVSINCITYNHEKFIADAIESFLMQKTNFKFEILIHDDASSDRTSEIIKQYELKYPDIIKPIYQLVNQHSKGISLNTVTPIGKEIKSANRPFKGNKFFTLEEVIEGGGGLFLTNSMLFRKELVIERPECLKNAPVGDYNWRDYYNSFYICIYNSCDCKKGINTNFQ